MAVTRLEIRPHHRLLEIGCGSGTTLSEVAQRLTTGSVLAIDRSSVSRATAQNAAHIARGVVHIVQTDLAELEVKAQSFDSVYALNVDLSHDPASIQTIRRVLRRKGRLVLGFRRPDERHLAAKAARLEEALNVAGLPASIDWVDSMHLFVLATRA
jgi:ubiquinone/menaquinone biosynthesis C-methylase UbiE